MLQYSENELLLVSKDCYTVCKGIQCDIAVFGDATGLKSPVSARIVYLVGFHMKAQHV